MNGLVERYLQIHERRLDDLETLLRELIQRHAASASASVAATPTSNPASVRLAVSSGAISASSATAPGSGFATPVAYDPGMAAYVATGSAIAVLNAGVEIAASKRCFLLVDETGAVYATTEEC